MSIMNVPQHSHVDTGRRTCDRLGHYHSNSCSNCGSLQVYTAETLLSVDFRPIRGLPTELARPHALCWVNDVRCFPGWQSIFISQHATLHASPG